MNKNKSKNSKKTDLNEIKEIEADDHSDSIKGSNKVVKNESGTTTKENNLALSTDKSVESEDKKVKESQKIKAEKYKTNTVIEEVVGEEEDHSLLKTNNNSMINTMIDKDKVKEQESEYKETKDPVKLNLNSDFSIEFEKNLEHRELLDKTKVLNTSGTKFESFLIENMIPNAFNKIFAELITKNVKSEDFFAYTAARLNEIGKEYEDLKSNYQFENIT